VTPDLSIGGSNIEFVEKWPHLGHMISLNLSDDYDDVSLCTQSLIGQINTVLCRFERLDSTLPSAYPSAISDTIVRHMTNSVGFFV